MNEKESNKEETKDTKGNASEHIVARKIIGKTSSPEREPSTTTQFQFWLAEGIRLNPFDFVTAEHLDNSQTIGISQEIKNLTDAESHITNYVSHDFGKPQAEPYV